MLHATAATTARRSRRRISAIAGVLLLLSATVASSHSPQQTSAVPAPWAAQWITAADDDGRDNRWLAFRQQLELSSAPARALARIAASDKYWLWVNGRQVVFEGQLKRGPTPDDTYFDTIDLTPHLRPGLNTIAIAVWYWGRSGYSHRSAGTAGLLFDADIDGRSVASDAGWRARVLPAYGSTAGPPPSIALTEQHIRYDARLAIPGWQNDDFDDRAWPTARELGAPPIAPWNRLVERPVPLWRDSGLLDYAALEGLPAGDEGGEVVARLPYNAQVTPYLRVDATPGRVVRIRTDTYNTSRKISLRAEYVTREGVQEYESYGWLSGHEVHYSIPPGVRVLDLKYRETGYDADFRGRFQSDDPALDVLWTKARRTLYVNMRDNHMDCPDRERAQWYGDLVVQLGQVFYALDAERGPLLARKGLRQLGEWQRGDGALVTPVPYGDGMDSPELPLQMLAAVGRYGLWTYYLHTGDIDTLREVYPAAREYLSLWDIGADGLVLHRPGDWTWPDWGDHADYRVLENAWYYLALEGAAAIATEIGAGADVAGYSERMAAIRGAFRPRFWRGDHFRSTDHTGATDDRANALAVLAGFARTEDYPALLDVLGTQQHASPYMEKYVLEAMLLMDGAPEALYRMKRRYRAQIESPLTTLWEDWEWQPWNGYNHAWAGGPLTLLSGYVAGVRPAAPGWEEYAVRPRPGLLRRVDAVVPTPHGDITVRVERDTSRFELAIDAPVHGSVALPATDQARLRVNGLDVWAEGRAIGDSTGVRVLAVSDGLARLAVPAGAWTLEAVGVPPATPPTDELFNLSENPIRSSRVFFNFRETPSLAAVFTLDGRRVVDLTRRMAGGDRAVWDVTNDHGARVAPGVYLFVAKVGDEVVRRRLVVNPRDR